MLILGSLLGKAFAQEENHLSEDGSFSSWHVSEDTIRLNTDSLLIVAAKNKKGDALDFTYLSQSAIAFQNTLQNTDSIQIIYRIIHPEFLKDYALFNVDQIDSNIAFRAYFQDDHASHILNVSQDVDALDIQGTYGRSFSLGNQQDLSMEAAFNLQVSGYFLDSVKIEAALTDQHLPFQAEGNTQQIKEFDQLYIKLSKNRHQLTAGDFWMRSQPSHFLKSNKKVQGLQYVLNYDEKENKNWDHQLNTNFSVAKGTITRNVLNVLEGNQGPYKLQGAHGELFFIILSGTEKVYLDGQILTRGEENDYIIDYNSSEITFMPRMPITKNSRIQVEFEYQDRNYLNTLIYNAYEAKYKDKWRIGFQIYSNQDAKNQPYLQELTPEQKLFLKDTEGPTDEMFFPSLRPDTLTEQSISYIMIDTVVNGNQYDSVLVYDPESELQKYQVVFTHFGLGGGDYILSNRAGNGKIFEWVAPENGISQGEYAPVIPLVTPKMHQILNLYTNYQFDSLKSINAEWSTSHYNANLFANNKVLNNIDHAAKLSYESMDIYDNIADSIPKTTWENKALLQMIDRAYKALEPFREIEFSRNWNLDIVDSSFQKEWLMGFESLLKSNKLKRLGISNYTLSHDFKDWSNKSDIVGNLILGRWDFNMQSSILIQKIVDQSALNSFIKPDISMAYYLERGEDAKRLELRYYSESLKNHESQSPLTRSSFQFHELKLGKDFKFKTFQSKMHYKWRQDFGDLAQQMTLFNQSQEVAWEVGLLDNVLHQLSFLTTYRWVDYHHDIPEGAGNKDQNILGRIQYQGSYLKQLLQQQINFDFGSGQEQKKSFVYIKVPTGQGQYMWIDYNGDGIEQANEFELAIYEDEKNYIRILTPTNDFIKVNYMQMQYQLQFRPDQFFKNKKDNAFAKLMSMFSNRLQVQINNRMQAEEGLKTYNPFYFPENLENLVHRNAFWSNHASFQTPNKKWNVDYNLNRASNQILLYYGLENTINNRENYRLRWNFHPEWRLSLQYSPALKSFEANDEVNRNHATKSQSWEPEITYTIPSFMSWALSYQYQSRAHETFETDFGSTMHQVLLNGRISKYEWGYINTKLQWSNLKSDQLIQGPLQYIIMDGLQEGHNFIWNVQWERSIGKGMNFSIFYEGRASESRSAIHTARVTLRALL